MAPEIICSGRLGNSKEIVHNFKKSQNKVTTNISQYVLRAKYRDKMTLVVLCVKKSMANMEIRNIFLDY